MKKVAKRFPNELKKSRIVLEIKNLSMPMPAIVRTPKPYNEKALHLYDANVIRNQLC